MATPAVPDTEEPVCATCVDQQEVAGILVSRIEDLEAQLLDWQLRVAALEAQLERSTRHYIDSQGELWEREI